MNLNLKKKPKPDACDVMRCKTKTGLTVVDNTDGAFKVCDRHLAMYREETATPPPAEPETVDTAPVTSSPVIPSLEGVLALVEPVRVEAESQLEALRDIVITTQAGVDMAAAMLSGRKASAEHPEAVTGIKARLKALEAQRTSVTKPMLDLKRTIDGWFKPASAPLLALEALLKKAIGGYIEAQKQAQLTALEAGDHDAALAVEPAVMPAGMSTRTTWRFEVVDVDAIPRDFMVPDAAKIQAHVTAHKANSSIVGVRAYPDTGIAARVAS